MHTNMSYQIHTRDTNISQHIKHHITSHHITSQKTRARSLLTRGDKFDGVQNAEDCVVVAIPRTAVVAPCRTRRLVAGLLRIMARVNEKYFSGPV